MAGETLRVALHSILTMLLHIGFDPLWYGSEQRCETVRPLKPGQFRLQTYTVFGSNFGANQQPADTV
jgi:hypothetical protein